MNILKHMEAVFVATAVFAVGGSYLIDTLPEAHAKPAVSASAALQAPVVVVKAKRMSAEEKRQSLQAEQFAATQTPASRI
jgi:surface antigen